MLAGETSAQACVRETREELGFPPNMAAAEMPISCTFRETIVDVYVIRADVEIADLRLQASEVAEAAWLNREQFLALARDKARFSQDIFLEMLIRMFDETEEIWKAPQSGAEPSGGHMEQWDAYDKHRNFLGYTIPRGEIADKTVRHLAVHMAYYNSKGEILVQRRADDKELAPGLWALTGGAALAGETSDQACVRETREEMGFSPDMATAEIPISFVTRESIVDVYVLRADVELEDLRLQKSEVAEAAWLNREQFIALAHDERKFWQYRYMDMLIRMFDETEYIWNRR